MNARAIAQELEEEQGPLLRAAKAIFAAARSDLSSAWLAHKAEVLEKDGDLDGAATLFDQLAIKAKAAGIEDGEQSAGEYSRRSRSLRDRLERAVGTLPGAEPSSLAQVGSGVNQLSKEDAVVLRSLLSTARRIRRISFITADVQQFVDDFRLGAKDPETYLRHPAVTDAELAATWLRVPPDKRIFIIGSGEDTAFVHRWSKDMEKDGYVTFFYQFCYRDGQLCGSEGVGAFFATSGKAFIADSPSAQQSRYVSHEIAVAHRLNNDDRAMLFVTPGKIMEAATAGTALVGMLIIGFPAGPLQPTIPVTERISDWRFLTAAFGGFGLVSTRRLKRALAAAKKEDRLWKPEQTLLVQRSRSLMLRRMTMGIGLAATSAGLGYWNYLSDHRLFLLLLAGIFGIFGGIAAVQLIPRASYVRLTPSGFIVRSCFRRKPLTGWHSVGTFRIVVSDGTRRVEFERILPGRSKRERLAVGYDKTPDELTVMLNDWRDCALAQTGSFTEPTA